MAFDAVTPDAYQAQRWQKTATNLINRRLSYWLPVDLSMAGSLKNAASLACTPLGEALSYTLMNGGKRLRPLLVLAASGVEDFDGMPFPVLDVACALEIVHCYSLVHDDLPSMDNDDWRRGQPTVHKKYDEATAVLVGDALQAIAFEVIAQLPGDPGAINFLLLSLARAARAMCAGQAIDWYATGRHLAIDELKAMHSFKTGALIEAAVLMGALCGVAAEVPLRALPMPIENSLKDFSAAISLGFQIRDDILDATADSAILGKTAGKDHALKKVTFATVMPLAAAERIIGEQWALARRALTFMPAGMEKTCYYLRSLGEQMLYRSS